MAAASTTGTTCPWARSCGFSRLSRVDTCLNGGLQFFNVGQLLITRNRCRGCFGISRGAMAPGNHLLVERQVAIAAQSQLLTVGQGDRNGAGRASNQPFTREDAITFGKRSARSIASYRVDLADNLTDDTD
nr:hypothetical protein [Pseudomonas cavernicola]